MWLAANQALAANTLLLYKCGGLKWLMRLRKPRPDQTPERVGGTAVASDAAEKFSMDDPGLFHTLEIFGMLCNLRTLLSKLGFRGWKASHSYVSTQAICGSL